MQPKTLVRKGRPPKVKEDNGVFTVRVRNWTLMFAKGTDSLIRKDREVGVPPDEVKYGKQVVEMSLMRQAAMPGF